MLKIFLPPLLIGVYAIRKESAPLGSKFFLCTEGPILQVAVVQETGRYKNGKKNLSSVLIPLS